MSEDLRKTGNQPSEDFFNEDRKRRKDQIEKVVSHNLSIRESMTKKQTDLLLNTPACFDVQPGEIIFKDVEPGQIYQMTVFVKNLTKGVKRIRVFQPKNSCFRCDYAMMGPIAPGLSIELVVSFESEEKGEFNDSITIISDNDIEYNVKISAYSAMAKMIFEPFINFGFIQAGTSKTETIYFKNEGSMEGRVNISLEDIKDLKVEPKGTFVLQKDELKKVAFTYSPKEPGIFRGEIKVQSDGKSFTDKIDVNATCVEFLRFIINEEGEELTKIDFGSVLFGKKKQLTGHLVNNSPEGFYFKTIYMQGLHNIYKEENNILTPHEQGVQQTRRQLHIEPTEGYVGSYSQIPLTFACKTLIEEDHTIWTRNYAMGSTNKEQRELVDFKELVESIRQTAVFFFKKEKDTDKAEENRPLMMQAEAVCPRVAFDRLTADFGKVAINKSSTITVKVKNENECSTVRVDCPKSSVFECQPQRIILKPNEESELSIGFYPKNLGKIAVEHDFVVNKYYKIPFKFIGFGKQKNSDLVTSQVPLGTESQLMFDSQVKQSQKAATMNRVSKSEANLTLPPIKASAESSLAGSKPRDYLKESRVKRLNDKKQKLLKEQIAALEAKAKELIPRYHSQQKEKAKKNKNEKGEKAEEEKPLEDWILKDVKFLFNDHMDGLEIPKLEVPKTIDPLFVVKPLGKYEPNDKEDMEKFYPDANVKLRRLPESTAIHAINREINQNLTNELLKHIQAGPTEIDFGKVFVNSRSKKYFHIKNQMKFVVKARMMIEDEELEESEKSHQIIATGQTASFELCFKSSKTCDLYKIMKYIINDKHIFKYVVRAVAIPVQLELSDNKIELVFTDDNNELTTHKTLSLKNPGNDTAHFDWYSPSPALFRVEPALGEVPPGGIKKVQVIYAPNGPKGIEDEVLDLRVRHGPNKTLTVTGIANETRCEMLHPSVINFGSMAVGDETRMNFTIKNHSARHPAIFAVDESTLGPFIKVTPMKGRIVPDGVFKLEFEFSSKEQQIINENSFNIIVRGSKTLVIPYTGSIIVPRVILHERRLDFNEITYGNSATIPFTIENTSPITAKLSLDLRVKEELPETENYQCLRITQEKLSDDDSIVIEEKDIDPEELRSQKQLLIENEKQDILNNEKSLDDIMPSNDSEDEENKEPTLLSDPPENNENFMLTLKPNKKYTFLLHFTPHLTKTYNFNLPLTLNGFEQYQDLMKQVHCKAIHPRIVLDPIDGVRDFKKKTISQLEGNESDKMILKISNPDPTNSTRFFIDTKQLDDNKLFYLSKTEGVVAAKSSIQIVIDFRPTIPGVWNCQLPLYIDDERSTPKSLITLKGESAFARIMFDRREVIMPVVPLGVESSMHFYVYNDGYHSANFKGNIIETFQHFPIKVSFPDGPNLNTKKHKMKVELSYIAKSPVSFTTQLFFEDDQRTNYSIYVSGTADNSIMTNYGYFLRTPRSDFELIEREDRPVAIKAADRDGGSDKNSVTFSKLSGSSEKRVGLGYPPIPFDNLDRACKHMARFLTIFVPQTNIEAFPHDVIAKNGDYLTKSVEHFAKMHLGLKGKFSSDMKKADRVKLLYDNYTYIINFLKKEGAYLNNIRPEYLLSWQDLLLFYKKNPSPNTISAANRLSEMNHKYLSTDSWLIIFNQILKIYMVNKITLSKFKSMTMLPDHHKKLPNGSESSTIFNHAELILQKWSEISYFKLKDQHRKLNFLGEGFNNGIALGCLVHLFTSNCWKPLRNMKEVILAQTEVYENMTVIMDTFKDMGLHYVPEFSELACLEPRELVLFLAYLFNSLPSYQPRESIEFECKINDTVCKKVVLQNQNTTPLIYDVILEACEDFSIKEESVRIEPKSFSEFFVSFKGRISKSVSGKLVFKPRREYDMVMAPIVYDLKSKITGRYTSDRQILKDVMLYDLKSKELRITNPFSKDCEFNIEVIHMASVPTEQNTKKKRQALYQRKTSDTPITQSRILPSFFIQQEKVQLRKGKMLKLKFSYLPLTFEVHTCQVVLIDEEVGELQYEIIGIPLYPNPIQIFNISSSVDNKEIDPLNTSLVYTAKQRAYQSAHKLAQSMRDHSTRSTLLHFINEQKDQETFKIESTSSKELGFPSTFTIYNLNKLSSIANENPNSMVDPSNFLQLSLNLRYPVKDYVIMLIMKNEDLSDVRLYECVVTILPKVFKAALDLTTPVRIPLEQSIPVTNPTDHDVMFNIEKFDTNLGEYFHFPRVLKVKANHTEQLELVYNPLWKGVSQSILKIQNPNTREEFHYAIKGTAEEPLSENHFKVKCNVGEDKKLTLTINNSDSYSKEYEVTFDAYGLKGPRNVRAEANSETSYKVDIKPVLGGIYAGSLTFTDQNKHYIWYTFELEYQGRKNVRSYELHGVIRKNNPFDIELDNPSDEQVEYKVSIKGEGLSGPESVFVPPRGKETYQLNFFPLRLIADEGAVVFTNSKVGEILCKMALHSNEPTPTKLPIIKCEVGKTQEVSIELENPSNKPVRVVLAPFSSDTFTVSEKDFEIAPCSFKIVKVVYNPVEIDVQNSVELSFQTENMGSWKYLVFGKGLYPTSYPVKEYVLELQKDSSGILLFKNPFKATINISVKLELHDHEDEGAFELINKKTKVSIVSGGMLQIPVSFYPSEIKDYNCTVVVYLSDKISWKFPIRVVTESKTKAIELTMSTICREKMEKDFVISLPGLSSKNSEEPYRMELLSVAKGDVDIIKKWFQVLNDQAFIDAKTGLLRFNIRFTPQKPLKTFGEVLITRASGGKWR